MGCLSLDILFFQGDRRLIMPDTQHLKISHPGTGRAPYESLSYARRFARPTSAQYARNDGQRSHEMMRSCSTRNKRGDDRRFRVIHRECGSAVRNLLSIISAIADNRSDCCCYSFSAWYSLITRDAMSIADQYFRACSPGHFISAAPQSRPPQLSEPPCGCVEPLSCRDSRATEGASSTNKEVRNEQQQEQKSCHARRRHLPRWGGG